MGVRVKWSRPVHYAIILLVHLELFLPPTAVGGNDWWTGFHPMMEAARREIVHYGQLPWWNPWAAGGVPLFAVPEIPVLSIDMLLVLLLGPIVGLKVGVVVYALIGYEGTRALVRHLFRGAGTTGPTRALVTWASVLPVFVTAAVGHVASGGYSYVAFDLFPWLLYFGLTWRGSTRRSIGLGATAGVLLLAYVHYVSIMALTITGAVVLTGLVRGARSRGTWARLALAGTLASGLAFTRVAVAAQWVSAYPPADDYYPLTFSPGLAARSLVEPMRSGSPWPVEVSGFELKWWEVNSYVGGLAVLLALAGLRRDGRWRVRWWHVVVPILFLAAWTNACAISPSYWLRRAPPWSSMVLVTRWRLFGSYFLLIAAVGGLVTVARRFPRLAWAAAALAVADVGGHVAVTWHGKFPNEPPPIARAPDPPVSIAGDYEAYWPGLRRNQCVLGAEMPVFRYMREQWRATVGSDEPGYRGEFVARHPVTVALWSPNRIVLSGTPGDLVRCNVNPGNYWLVNGTREWPQWRGSEPARAFLVRTDPADGRIVLIARPPRVGAFLAVQALCTAAAAGLMVWTVRARRRTRRVEGAAEQRGG